MFSIEVPFFNLDQTYASGQCLRWIKIRDGKYVIPHKDKAIKVEQQRNRLVLNCTDEEFYSIWYHYFDLNTDYMEINYKVRKYDDFFLVNANRASGVRIPIRDYFETMVTYLLLKSESNQLLISKVIEYLCSVCGVKHIQSMREIGKVTWFEFPTPHEILNKKDKLDNKLLFNQKDIIIQLCQDIIDEWISIPYLMRCTCEEAKSYLSQFDYISSEMVENICLYALHHSDVFPIDSTITSIIEKEFDMSPEDFIEWYLSDNKDSKGIVKQYMLYNKINPIKEAKHGVSR